MEVTKEQIDKLAKASKNYHIQLTESDLNALCDGDYVMVEGIVEEILNQAREMGWEYKS